MTLEHIPVLIDSNTRIPDRTNAILNGGESPCKEMILSAKRLEKMGADFLIISCNAAHYFYEEVSSSVNIPIINMIEETAARIIKLGIKKVGLLGTRGTFSSGIYSSVFKKYKINYLEPTLDEQEKIMNLIYKGIKANNYSFELSDFYSILKNMEKLGVNTFVLGCTELPIAFEKFSILNSSINPTAILAARAIVLAGGKLK